MSVARERLLQLMQVQCRIFASTYNPEGLRLGNKILRQRLRGPALSAYYPPRGVSFQDLQREFGPELIADNEEEDDRLDHIQQLKIRGKSKPKKKRTAPVVKGGKK